MVRTPLAMEVYGRIARIVRRHVALLILWLKTLQACPCFQQRSVHREVFV
jgi:hypothetical protein